MKPSAARTCPGCTESFTPNRKYQRFCTPVCRDTARRRRMHEAYDHLRTHNLADRDIPCAKCSTCFAPTREWQKFCSTACRRTHHLQRMKEAYERKQEAYKREQERIAALAVKPPRKKVAAATRPKPNRGGGRFCQHGCGNLVPDRAARFCSAKCLRADTKTRALKEKAAFKAKVDAEVARLIQTTLAKGGCLNELARGSYGAQSLSR